MSEIAMWLDQTFYQFDAAVFEFMHGLAQKAGGFFTPFFQFITFLGEEGWFFIVLGLALLLFPKTRKAGVAILIGLIFGLLITNITLKNLIARFRPFVTDPQFRWYWHFVGEAQVGEYSFPSGHTTSAMAAGLALFIFGNKKWSWTGVVFALLMGLTRIYLVVHYATDVIGGVLAGALAAVLACVMVQLIFKLVIEKHPKNKFCRFVTNADIRDVFKKSYKR